MGRTVFLSLTLLISLSSFAEAHQSKTEQSRTTQNPREEAIKIFNTKCVECHKDMGSDVFEESGLPNDRILDEVEKRLLPDSQEPMPPPGEPQLTESEKAKVTAWLNQRKEELKNATKPDPKACYKHTKDHVSEARGKEILKQACVMCHAEYQAPEYGEMPWTMLFKLGENAVKTQHTLFLTAEGDFKGSILGDLSRVKDMEDLKRRYTSLDRLINQVSGHFMPLRGSSLSATLSKEDRKELLKYLNQVKKRENCPLVNPLILKSKGVGSSPLKAVYETVADKCRSLGGWVPTEKALEEYLAENNLRDQPECLWTSSYSGDPNKLRVFFRLTYTGGKATIKKFFGVPEKIKCASLCGVEPQ